jgi:hypothetical protein
MQIGEIFVLEKFIQGIKNENFLLFLKIQTCLCDKMIQKIKLMN